MTVKELIALLQGFDPGRTVIVANALFGDASKIKTADVRPVRKFGKRCYTVWNSTPHFHEDWPGENAEWAVVINPRDMRRRP